jgi:monoterpene epsilon-lactone hydrolase
MPSTELQTVLDMLRVGSPLAGSTIHEMRSSMEATSGAVPPPADVAYVPTRMGGVAAEWARAKGASASRALLYFHGGGYCVGSVRTHRLLVGALSRSCGVPVLSLDYRLAPEHPHPAAVDDAVAAYRGLLAEGIPAAQIAFAGDSAGGGLTAAALLALRAHSLPAPAAGVCLSPWFDLALSGETMRTNIDVDPMCKPSLLAMMAEAYLAGADPRTPGASPLYDDLTELPPMLVQVGTAETLLDDARRFAARAERAGARITLEVWDDMIHVWQAFAMVLPEGQQAIDRIGAFVRAALGEERP